MVAPPPSNALALHAAASDLRGRREAEQKLPDKSITRRRSKGSKCCITEWPISRMDEHGRASSVVRARAAGRPPLTVENVERPIETPQKSCTPCCKVKRPVGGPQCRGSYISSTRGVQV
eukprot:CAMPEP_0204162176 /NCGR_PEP_ID=MMETSP0361-20130328/35331_1 /ASSEMBLY_ACC=CAM_ASM_000343 /TAXON_ID=268821 /ORGANISM="Scrippsiella Hangoei, Strain SHTV-5" /LENGTH=118 /DNA_ID=CAMNT_0051118727 /DNA_START=223 /DNA_END=580 /DNA_ORIENTATION=+